MKKNLLLFLSLFSIYIFSQTNVEYDPAFGTNGKIYPLHEISMNNAVSAQTSNGKIITVADNNAISRRNIDGSLDTTFGDSGIKVFASSTSYDIKDIAILSDDSIIILMNNFYYSSYLIKLRADGSTDISFNSVGNLELIIQTGNYYNRFLRLKVAEDDSIFVLGHAGLLNTAAKEIVGLVKITKNGSYDNSFSLDGKYTITTNESTSSFAFDIDENNNIFIGYHSSTPGFLNLYITKVGQSGNIISNFGISGTATIKTVLNGFKSFSHNDLKLFPDGRIIVAGESATVSANTSNLNLIRLTAQGDADNTNGSWIKYIDIDNNSDDFARRILMVNNSSFYLAGSVKTGGINYGLLTKHTSNGALDTTFNYSGIFTNNFLPNTDSHFQHVLLQKDNKILLTAYNFTAVKTTGMIRIIDKLLLAINEQDGRSIINIYPNPATEFIIVKGKNLHDTAFSIFDSAGRKIKGGKLNNKMKIMVADLSTGTYMLQINNTTYKFIKI